MYYKCGRIIESSLNDIRSRGTQLALPRAFSLVLIYISSLLSQTLVETKTSKSSKETKKPETIIDPLAGGVVDDPLSVTSDPLSLVLLDPLSRAAAEKTSAKKVLKHVTI